MVKDKVVNGNIVIVTDSLGIPREQPKRMGPKIVWPFRIKNVSYIHTRTGYTIIDVVRDMDLHIKACEPDLIVLQVGIVDCAPRVLSRTEARLIRTIPGLEAIVGWLIKKYRKQLLRLRKIQYVPITVFIEGLKRLKEKNPGVPIIAVSILPACAAYESLVPGISNEIKKYNSALAENLCYIDPYEGFAPEKLCVDDYHHLNEKGHDLVVKAVNEAVIQRSL